VLNEGVIMGSFYGNWTERWSFGVEIIAVLPYSFWDDIKVRRRGRIGMVI